VKHYLVKAKGTHYYSTQQWTRLFLGRVLKPDPERRRSLEHALSLARVLDQLRPDGCRLKCIGVA